MPACCQIWGSSQDWESHRSRVNSSGESKAIRADSCEQPASWKSQSWWTAQSVRDATWVVACWGPDLIPACFFLCLWNVLDHLHLTGYPEQPVWSCICKFFVNSCITCHLSTPKKLRPSKGQGLCFILFFLIVVKKTQKTITQTLPS